jgi:lipopolysaccharide export system protein LptC
MNTPQTLAPAQPRATKAVQPWHWKTRQWAMAYMPILLMSLLAAGTWWLIKNSPTTASPQTATPARHDPDYEMRNFSVQRHPQSGHAGTKIEGSLVRHYPDTDTLEIDHVRLRAIDTQGQVTTAVARNAIAKGDGSEVELMGNAEVVRENTKTPTEPLRFQGDYLRAFINEERITSNKPVTIAHAGTQVKAGGMSYTHHNGIIVFTGKPRAIFNPKK